MRLRKVDCVGVLVGCECEEKEEDARSEMWKGEKCVWCFGYLVEVKRRPRQPPIRIISSQAPGVGSQPAVRMCCVRQDDAVITNRVSKAICTQLLLASKLPGQRFPSRRLLRAGSANHVGKCLCRHGD